MGISLATAILIATAVSAGTAVVQSQQTKKSGGKLVKDKLAVTAKGIAKKGARAALVVGSPRGVLSIEDQTATSGRGTLLGN